MEGLTERVVVLSAQAESAAGQLEAASGQAAELEAQAAQCEAALEARTAAEADAAAAEQAAAAADRDARAAAHELEHRHQLATTRLAGLSRALEHGEGLSPAARALHAAGATLVVAGVEAAAGFERAVAAALGWRAGAVVAQQLDEAVELLRSADGELGVVLASAAVGQAGLPPCPGARPLAEVVTIGDPAVARLIEGVWLVDDLAAVSSGVAVTDAGEGIDVERGELWRAADAGEAAWLAARAERDRVSSELPALEAELAAARAAAQAAAGEAAAASDRAQAARAELAVARAAATQAADRARQALARRDANADELARGDAARDLAARDLEADGGRLAELESLVAACDREEAERRAVASSADEQHARLELERRELADAAALDGGPAGWPGRAPAAPPGRGRAAGDGGERGHDAAPRPRWMHAGRPRRRGR